MHARQHACLTFCTDVHMHVRIVHTCVDGHTGLPMMGVYLLPCMCVCVQDCDDGYTRQVQAAAEEGTGDALSRRFVQDNVRMRTHARPQPAAMLCSALPSTKTLHTPGMLCMSSTLWHGATGILGCSTTLLRRSMSHSSSTRCVPHRLYTGLSKHVLRHLAEGFAEFRLR